MDWAGLLVFENRNVVIVALALLTFLLSLTALGKIARNMDSGARIVISMCISLIAGWYLYRNPESFNESFLAFGLIFLGMVIVGFIMRAFYRFWFRHLRR